MVLVDVNKSKMRSYQPTSALLLTLDVEITALLTDAPGAFGSVDDDDVLIALRDFVRCFEDIVVKN